MNKPAAKGSQISKRESLSQVQETIRKSKPGFNHPELALPDVPPRIAYLWEWFLEVQNGERLTWEELRAWSTLTQKDISPVEAQALRELSTLQQRINTQDP